MKFIETVKKMLPGCAIALVIAVVAKFLEQLEESVGLHLIGASVIAMFIGMIVNRFYAPNDKTKPGIKFTSNNFMEMLECIRLEDGRFDILNGFDEMLLCGMAVGARGGVGSTYNYSLRTYQNIYDAFMAGDLEQARAAQQESVDIVHVIINHGGGIRGGKAIMKLVGIDCGDCRLPLAPYTEAEIARLDEELRAIGFKK